MFYFYTYWRVQDVLSTLSLLFIFAIHSISPLILTVVRKHMHVLQPHLIDFLDQLSWFFFWWESSGWTPPRCTTQEKIPKHFEKIWNFVKMIINKRPIEERTSANMRKDEPICTLPAARGAQWIRSWVVHRTCFICLPTIAMYKLLTAWIDIYNM